MTYAPLRLAFIGYNAPLTKLFFREFLEANHDQMAAYSTTGGGALMLDGTRIFVTPNHIYMLDGLCVDQVIVACDSRGVKPWPEQRRHLLDALIDRSARSSQVRAEDRVIIFNLDDKEGAACTG